MLKKIILITFLTIGVKSIAQDLSYPSEVISILCSDKMHGRGYIENGDKIASLYISNEFKKNGLLTFNGSYLQKFELSVNTFPKTIFAQLDNTISLPGENFIISASSPSISGEFPLYWIDSLQVTGDKKIKKHTKGFICFDASNTKKKEEDQLIEKIQEASQSLGVLITKNKLTWSVSQIQKQYPIIEFTKQSTAQTPSTINVTIESTLIPSYSTQNIIGYIKGEIEDSFVVFSGHYDHLGKMGEKAIFRGANDNASGIAMLLSLAKHYTDNQNKPKYSIAYMAFGAEEAGILGSKHYTENPLFPLEKIKILINLDLMGFGEKGITIVNGRVFKDEYNKIYAINEKEKYVMDIKARGKAKNSDHYYFSEKGIPSFFIYTRGGPGAYHDIHDTPETIDLSSYNNVIKLLIDYVNSK